MKIKLSGLLEDSGVGFVCALMKSCWHGEAGGEVTRRIALRLLGKQAYLAFLVRS